MFVMIRSAVMTLQAWKGVVMPATSSNSAVCLTARRDGQFVDADEGDGSHGERVRAAPPQVSSSANSRSDALAVLAARLRSLKHVPVAMPEESAAVARMAVSAVVACASDLQRLVALLDEDVRQRDRLELELLDAQRELQRVRQELLDSQIRAKRARHMAFHDALTGLPNRISFEARSRHALALHSPHDRKFGVMYIDLDGFKSINDVHGHRVGDELLKVVGSRLNRAIRVEDSVSRHGGDEFICLLGDVQSEEQVAQIARKLFDTVSAHCQLGPLALRVRPSIGVAIFPRDGTTVEALLKSADSAMFWAKKHQRGHAFFSQLLPRQAFPTGQRVPSESTTSPVAAVSLSGSGLPS